MFEILIGETESLTIVTGNPADLEMHTVSDNKHQKERCNQLQHAKFRNSIFVARKDADISEFLNNKKKQ
ncbi:MAG: hypothetical protein ABIT58_06660 [Ferruginibacter sp.]